jgi:hypothetical protein
MLAEEEHQQLLPQADGGADQATGAMVLQDPAEEEEGGEDLVQLGIYGTAPPLGPDPGPVQEVTSASPAHSPALTSPGSSGAGSPGGGVWVDVEGEAGTDGEHAAVEMSAQPSTGDSAAAYWTAYHSYLQAMQPGQRACSSYSSSMTGTTAESLGSSSGPYYQLTGSASLDSHTPGTAGLRPSASGSHSQSYSGERISDFTAEGAVGEEEEEEEEVDGSGDGDAMFESDEA